ncbi:hypothetical protein [Spartinivicinus ruber]|uniref:hypothetical protein n=1 Tax=Spartinivicinus ruber TaxID=2683272 RepID=UPI0013D54387|nr:hypothetical protein [Spartinivicinus ruber]
MPNTISHPSFKSIEQAPLVETSFSTTINNISQFDSLAGSHLGVTAWSPSVANLDDTKGTFDVRLSLIAQALEQSKNDVFIAPEYYWNQHGDELTPFSTEQKDELVEQLRILSEGQQDRLVIPGTIVWSDNDNKGVVHNSVFVFLNGEQLQSSNGLDRYDKLDLDYESKTFPALKWGEGVQAGFDINFKDTNVRIEICSDNGIDDKYKSSPASEIDLNLVLSSKIGDPFKNTKIGGSTVVCDGEGWSRHIEKLPPEPKPEDPMKLLREYLPEELRNKFMPKQRLKELLLAHVPREILQQHKPEWLPPPTGAQGV